MNGNSGLGLVLFLAINFLLNNPANAGVVKRSLRMVREVYPPDIEPDIESIQPQVCIVGDVVYAADETVPAEQPCLKCKCQPPGVQCETVQCVKKPGCKAIHRSNKCCPDYQCECEHNGKIYANGEKLETNPGGECKVCYCRGGEVQCAEVSCYIRNDCEGKRVSGTCCPKYDHCPPIDAVPDRLAVVTENSPNTLRPIIMDLWPEINLTETAPIPTVNSISEDSNKVPDTSDLVTVSPLLEEISISREDDNLHHRITIQEIIPERKEIPVTAPPKIVISQPQGILVIEEAIPTVESSSNDLNIDDSEPESSELSEVFHHPPPVLRVGDKLLILKKGGVLQENNTTTTDSVITIIGAEGLQRGGVEESLEVHEIKIQPKTDVQQIEKEIDIGATEASTVNESTTVKDVKNDESNDLELKLSESTHILSLVKRKNKPFTTTTETPTTTEKVEETFTTLASTSEGLNPTEPTKKTTLELKTIEPTIYNIFTTELPVTKVVNEANPETNPAYPPIPDVMPSVSETYDNSTADSKIFLPDIAGLLSNITLNETGHVEWLKNKNLNESLLDFKAGTLPEELLNQKSAIDETTTVTNEESTTIQDEKVEKPLLIAEIDVVAKDLEASLADGTTQKPVESLEEDSGELTTPRSQTQSAAIHSVENISIERPKEGFSKDGESFDMTLGLDKEKDIELGSVEITESLLESIPKDVELISSSPRSSSKGTTEKNVQLGKNLVTNMLNNVENTPNPTKLIKEPETSTYELLPTPEETNSKVVIKREIVKEKKQDDIHIFKDLEKELHADEDFYATKKPDEQRQEDERIFKELIEESEGKDSSLKPKSKEQETIDNLSNALAGVALKGQFPDPNVLKLIGELFRGKSK